jgi:hypothetical protein
LNVLILICGALIGVTLLALAIAVRGRGELAGVLQALALVGLFGVLDCLVMLRLSPAAVGMAKRLPLSELSKILFAALAVVALGVSVVVFFYATCWGLVLAAGFR